MLQDFVQQIHNTIHEVMNEMHTAMPGKIVSYSKGLVNVRPSIRYKTPSGKYMQYPVISGVPIVVPHGGNASITVPIKAGDDCLIIVSEQSLDEWLSGAEDDTQLLFDLTNAICIPGLCKTKIDAQEEANKTGGVVIACGSNKLYVSNESVAVSGNLKIEGNLTCTGAVKGNLNVEGNLNCTGTVKGSNIED